MGYPGGKNGDGVFQRIISYMPPHRVYLEPFVGGGAILRLKRPARLSIAGDLDGSVIRTLADSFPTWSGWIDRPSPDPACAGLALLSAAGILRLARSGNARGSAHRQNQREDPPDCWLYTGDGIALLERYPFQGDELVYCDPPYLHSTRSRRRLYQYEMTDDDHMRLLAAILNVKARVMISGYWNEMYATALRDWPGLIHFQATNRAGKRTTEWVWANFPEPVELHDYRYLGEGFRERERIKRKKNRWTARLRRMPTLERRALLSAIEEAWRSPSWSGDRPDRNQAQVGKEKP